MSPDMANVSASPQFSSVLVVVVTVVAVVLLLLSQLLALRFLGLPLNVILVGFYGFLKHSTTFYVNAIYLLFRHSPCYLSPSISLFLFFSLSLPFSLSLYPHSTALLLLLLLLSCALPCRSARFVPFLATATTVLLVAYVCVCVCVAAALRQAIIQSRVQFGGCTHTNTHT